MATLHIRLKDMIEGKAKKRETVFTHVLGSDKKAVQLYTNLAPDKDNIIHLGCHQDYGDIFKAWMNGKENEFSIYFGVAGDEFL